MFAPPVQRNVRFCMMFCAEGKHDHKSHRHLKAQKGYVPSFHHEHENRTFCKSELAKTVLSPKFPLVFYSAREWRDFNPDRQTHTHTHILSSEAKRERQWEQSS